MPVYDADGNELSGDALTTALGADTVTGLVKNSELFKTTRQEAIDRRLALKGQHPSVSRTEDTDEDDTDDDTEDDAPPPVQKPTAQKPGKQPAKVPADKPLTLEDVLAALTERQTAENTAKTTREALVTKVLKDNKLSETDQEVREIIAALPDEAAMNKAAAVMAKRVKRFDETPAGDTGKDAGAYAGILTNIDKNLFKKRGNRNDPINN